MTKSFVRVVASATVALAAAACAQAPKPAAIVKVSYSAQDRDCLARAMYFESHRGSDEGMRAVGTVVANRVKSGSYGSTVCDVVAQKGQFAPGVMTKAMDDSGAERARRVADEVLQGKRHPGVRNAMFFHTAGLRFPYPNMHYVLLAGGNAFYEKRSVETQADLRENARSRALALAFAKTDPTAEAKPIVVASLSPREAPQPQEQRAPQAQTPETPATVAVTTTETPSAPPAFAPIPLPPQAFPTLAAEHPTQPALALTAETR
ncbi:cell wall hydrolase [Methylopila henanensis]|uniref:Cell wall hydrolase n=1 Tax=Methylopila henanensis TaxID=873516 RepID=A0ABW4K7V8_9HYPH